MARILVQDDDQRMVLLDEKEIRPVHLNDEHSAAQLLERLEWAIRDAERRKVGDLRRRRVASGPRTASRPRNRRARIMARQSAVGRSFD
jgi:hypothetical protein